MIVPMKKVSLIILRDEKEQALEQLRRLGLVHIEISEGSGARLKELREQIAQLESSIYAVAPYKKKHTEPLSASTEEALTVAVRIAAIGEEIQACRADILSLESELSRLEKWGEIDPAALAELAEHGVRTSLYEMPSSEYRALDDTVTTVAVSRSKTSVMFLRISLGDDSAEPDILRFYRVELPQSSTAEMRAEIETLRGRIQALEAELVSLSAYIASMKAAITALGKEVEYETYSTGMASEDLTGDACGTVSIAYFKGFVRAEDLDRLVQVARENAWGILAEDPTEEDNAPTELRNNKFVSLIYPLTDFLGTVPGYFEYDISGWFLGFILIFFGIIFGDGGYGLLICAAAAVLIGKNLVQKKPVPAAFLLVGLFGLSTIAWGTLTCTWFGLSPAQLPGWLRSISVPFISNVYADKIWYPPWTNGTAGLTTEQNVQIFCFALALVQLSVAHVMGAVRNRRSVKLLGDVGSILQLLGIFYIVLSLVVNGEVFSFGLVIGGVPVGTVAIALVGVGFVMSFIFANYEGSIIKSILSSLTNIVSVLLGVVNVFSDIVSYIRLWAVGLAGAAISATVNALAGPMIGKLVFAVFAVVILVFGHGLNIILNVLSLIVHGIRLNTLEFSSHLGMSWSGHKYKPFKE